MPTLITEARNATVPEMLEILQAQADARYDVVVPGTGMRFENGNLVLVGHGPATVAGDTIDTMTMEPTDLTLRPTADCDDLLCVRTEIPRPYFRRMREKAVGLLDTNVNHWLHNNGHDYMVRAFRDDDNGGGIARSIHSPSYGAWDHLDFLAGVMRALTETGEPYSVRGLNLSERNLRMDVVSPTVTALAPALMQGYVSPFGGGRGEDLPVLHGGIRFTNSESGFGRLSIAPFVVVEICGNGATITRVANDLSFSKVHRGARQGIGEINWSDDTRRARIEAMVAEARDVVKTYLDPEWLAEQVRRIEAAGQKPLEGAEAAMDAIGRVSRQLHFTDAERDGIFTAFIEGQQATNGGVFQAITAHAQRVANPDRAAHLEDKALEALAIV